MDLLKDIKASLSDELALFNRDLTESLSSTTPLLKKAVEHFLSREGKRIRPYLCILSAKCCNPVVTDATIQAALALELLHSASIIHDDVVDETYERRGNPSMNAVFNNKVSVLVGDFFLASSLHSAVMTGSLSILDLISSLSKTLAEGEIEQIETAQNSLFSIDAYLSVIKKKTASLFAVCFEAGALSVNADGIIVDRLRQFGTYLGLCFQIKDDIFDYFSANEIGKPVGNDIREGKITLPLLYALKQSSTDLPARVKSILSDRDYSADNCAYLIAFAKQAGGIEYAESLMQRYKEEAAGLLNVLPDSAEKNLLLSSFDFIINRRY